MLRWMNRSTAGGKSRAEKIAAMVEKIARSDLSVDEFFRRYTVPFSRPQYFRYQARLAAQGLAGLLDGRRQGNRRKLTPEAEAFLRGAHQSNPQRSLQEMCQSLYATLGIEVDRLSHPVKEAAYRAAIHLNPQRGVERLAHFLQAALGIALMRAPQERLRLGGEFATISLTPPVQETGEALGRQAGLVTKILWPTKGHRVSAEKLVHGQIGSSDLFYHRCDLLGSAFPAGRGPVHPPQHSLNMAIWPACSAVFVRSWGIKRYNWTMLFRGEDSSSSWLLIISSTDSFLRARESRSYVELRSGPVSANCNSPKYQTIVMS